MMGSYGLSRAEMIGFSREGAPDVDGTLLRVRRSAEFGPGYDTEILGGDLMRVRRSADFGPGFETEILGGNLAQRGLREAKRATAIAGALLDRAPRAGRLAARVRALARRILEHARAALSAGRSTQEIAGLRSQFPANRVILGAATANDATARAAIAAARRAADAGARLLANPRGSVVVGGERLALPSGWDGGWSR